jgi:multiphosphoryl transfer protein
MPLEYHFLCPLPNGIHARPASALEAVARGFESEILLTNERAHRTVDGKSVLSVIGADIRLNDPCVLKISGRDEQRALNSLSIFLRDKFPRCDDPLPSISGNNGEFKLPRGLQNTAVFHRGIPMVHGIGRGRIVQAGPFNISLALPQNGVRDVKNERQKVEAALEQLIAWYDHRANDVKNKVEREIINAQRSMARDPKFRDAIFDAVETRQRTAAGAISDAEAHFSGMLMASGNLLLRDRVLDIQGTCVHLLRLIYGEAALTPELQINSDSIIVAESLRPDEFLALDVRHLKGLVLAEGGTTSHTVILARSYGIPTLAGANLQGTKLGNQDAVLDAEIGALVTNLTEPAWRYYLLEQKRLAGRQARLRKLSTQPAVTQDGHRLELSTNIATAEEAAEAFNSGAEGIGLFRTEMLFLDRESAPDMDEQFEVYRRVLLAAEGRPVIIRTLDIGGDKPLDYLNLPTEKNPFLGYRAVRIYQEFETLFRTQIRALIRASAFGQLKIMVPMMATVDEAHWIKKIIAEERFRCAGEGIPCDKPIPVGAMVEVPSAAFALDDLSQELDFFSIGTNDLLQYFMAVDRVNARVSNLYNPLQPTFLRLLKQIVDAAHAKKKWIGLCGEMGGEEKMLPLMVGLGLDEISASSSAIAGLKSALTALTVSDCRQLLLSMMNCVSVRETSELLDEFAVHRHTPLIEPDLLVGDMDAATKEEAIKQAVDQLYIWGRTDDSHTIEEAVWQREQTYSTGFGHGFAIPHCKTNAVKSNSLVFVKLRKPVVWGSLDGQPVRILILMVMREGDSEHMKVFSRLARYIMHEDFRARLENENDNTALCAFLKGKLEI